MPKKSVPFDIGIIFDLSGWSSRSRLSLRNESSLHVLTQNFRRLMQNNKIVNITDVIFAFNFCFTKMIYSLRKTLAKNCEVKLPSGIPLPFFFCFMVTKDDFNQPQNLLILYSFLNDRKQNIMADIIKILFNICFEHKSSSGIIVRNFALKIFKSFYSFECSFSYSVGIRIVNEILFKDWSNNVTKSMMDYSVPKMRFANLSSFWITKNKVCNGFGL